MTRTRLVSSAEIRRVLAALRDAGVPIGSVDIRADGVTVSPPGETTSANDFDRWQRQDAKPDANRERPARH